MIVFDVFAVCACADREARRHLEPLTQESSQADGFTTDHIITLAWRGASDKRIRESLQDASTGSECLTYSLGVSLSEAGNDGRELLQNATRFVSD